MGYALRVIEGGVPRLPAAEAPPLPAPDPALRPVRPDGFSRGFAFRFALTVSVAFHLALGAWAFFAIGGGEERAAGGTAEEMVIEGVVMVSPDSQPSPPSPPVIEQILGADNAEEIIDRPVTSVVEAPLVRPTETDAPAKPPEATALAVTDDSARPLSDPFIAATPASAPSPVADGMTTAIADDSPAAEPEAEAALADATAAAPEKDETAPPPVAEALPRPEPDDPVKPARIADAVAAVALEVAPIADEATPVADAVAKTEEVVDAPTGPAVKKAKPSASTPASASASTARGPKAGTVGAGGVKADAAGKAALSSYRGRLMSHLRRFQSSPPGGKSGTVVVSFTIAASGKVIAAGLASSSGSKALDGAALAMVRRASPFPPIPPGGGGQMSVRAPIRFVGR